MSVHNWKRIEEERFQCRAGPCRPPPLERPASIDPQRRRQSTAVEPPNSRLPCPTRPNHFSPRCPSAFSARQQSARDTRSSGRHTKIPGRATEAPARNGTPHRRPGECVWALQPEIQQARCHTTTPQLARCTLHLPAATAAAAGTPVEACVAALLRCRAAWRPTTR